METLKFSLATLFSPIDALNYVKVQRDKYNYLPAIILIFLIMPVRVINILVEHYAITTLMPADANILLEAVKMLAPVITWAIACFALTSIMDGETMLKEIFMAASYSMMPYLVFTIPLSLFSRVLGEEELGFYQTLQGLKWAWVIILFFVSVKVLNNYTMKKTLAVCLMSIIGVLLIWSILLLIYVLTNQLYAFVNSIIMELRMLYAE